MRDEEPEADRQLEDEGIPDLIGPLEANVATGDPQEGIIPPADDPLAADAFGTTAAEQLRGEPLDARLAEEASDVRAPEDDRHEAGQLVELEDPAAPDEEDDLVAVDYPDTAGEPAEENAVRIVPEDEVPGAYDAPTDGYEEEAGR